MINLRSKLKAYPKIGSSILDNYYTKEETDNLVNSQLEDYVREIDNPVEGVIYGRSNVEGNIDWVSLFGLEVFCKIDNHAGNDFPSAQDLDSFTPIDTNTMKYKTMLQPGDKGYLWVVSNKEIQGIEFISSNDKFNTLEDFSLIKILPYPIKEDGSVVKNFFCYKTSNKYIPVGLEYTWKIILK